MKSLMILEQVVANLCDVCDSSTKVICIDHESPL